MKEWVSKWQTVLSPQQPKASQSYSAYYMITVATIALQGSCQKLLPCTKLVLSSCQFWAWSCQKLLRMLHLHYQIVSAEPRATTGYWAHYFCTTQSPVLSPELPADTSCRGPFSVSYICNKFAGSQPQAALRALHLHQVAKSSLRSPASAATIQSCLAQHPSLVWDYQCLILPFVLFPLSRRRTRARSQQMFVVRKSLFKASFDCRNAVRLGWNTCTLLWFWGSPGQIDGQTYIPSKIWVKQMP